MNTNLPCDEEGTFSDSLVFPSSSFLWPLYTMGVEIFFSLMQNMQTFRKEQVLHNFKRHLNTCNSEA